MIDLWVVVGLVISAAVAVLFWMDLPRVPRDHDQPDMVRADYAKRRIVRALAYTGYALGLGEVVPIGRYLHSTRFLSLGKEANYTGVKVCDEELDGIPVRVYRPEVPETEEAGPGLVWIHGGGWVWGSTVGDDILLTELVRRLEIVIVSIDYRVAPENPFPTPFDDCARAAESFLDNPERFNVDPARVAIGGSSAGGNLTAAVCLKMRNDSRGRRFVLQIPVVPCVQALDFNTSSYLCNQHDGLLPKSWMINYWLWYALGFDGHKMTAVASTNAHVPLEVKDVYYKRHVAHQLVEKKYLDTSYKPPALTPGDENVWEKLKEVFLNPYFAPLMSDDFKGMPPAYVVTSALDVLRDDGIMYAQRLKQDGVSVVHRDYEKVHHANLSGYYKLRIGAEALDDLVQFLKERL